MYGAFYLSCCMYRNDLTSSLVYALCWYLPFAVISGVLFVTAADNPGFLDEHPSTSNAAVSANQIPSADEEMADIEMAKVVRRAVGSDDPESSVEKE